MIPKLRIMGRQTAHTTQRARRPLCLLAGALLAACALAPATAAAAAGEPIISEGTAKEVGKEVLVEAQINPEGLETSYEILVECPDHALCQTTEGKLPAINETRVVHLTLTAPQPDATYLFTVAARNAEGKASASWSFQVPQLTAPVIPPGACPNGCSKNEQYDSETPSWYTELLNSESNATLKEYEAKQTREQQEKKTKEATRYATEEAELKQAEERDAQEAAAREHQEHEEEEAEHPACRVPALKGETLAAARLALAKAHCRLGAVHQPAHHDGALYVSAQGAPAGKRLAHNARVALWVGAKRASRRRRTHQ